jgi:outer membrane protein, multidrug efflux system
VDFWGRYRALHDAARMAALASRYDRATIELTVMTSVASTYFEVLELKERVQVAIDNLKRAQDILDGLELELKVGTITALDVAQQETTVATLAAAVPPLQQQYEQALDALAILVGKHPEALELQPGALKDLAVPAVSPGLPAELLARRPDVAEAEAQLREANANIVAARAAFLPNISLTADGGWASLALAGLVSPANQAFSLTAGLTQPIFHGGALLGQYRLSQAQYAELLADYHKAVISAFGNVEDALVALRQSKLEVERQQVATDKALRAYELSQDQMHAGTVNILTVLNTENALFTAQDALVQVKLAHLQALVALFNALGGGWQQTT